MRSIPALLATLAVVVLCDVALIVGADRAPAAITITREPTAVPSRAAPRGSVSGTTATTSAAAPVVPCNTPAPSPTWVCQNGSWIMVATTDAVASGAGAAGSGASGGGSGNCLGVQPGAGWTCRGGVWIPPTGMTSSGPDAISLPGTNAPNQPPSPAPAPAAAQDPGSTPSPSPPGQPGCTAPNPAAGMPGVIARCVNGTWVIGG